MSRAQTTQGTNNVAIDDGGYIWTFVMCLLAVAAVGDQVRFIGADDHGGVAPGEAGQVADGRQVPGDEYATYIFRQRFSQTRASLMVNGHGEDCRPASARSASR